MDGCCFMCYYTECHQKTVIVGMLMYGKEADNRKQELDRQHHTIPCNINMKESLCREIIGGAFSIRHGQKCREKFD